MTLERRLVRLEAVRDARPDPEADAAFARLVAMLDRKAAGDISAHRGIEALLRTVNRDT